MQNADDPHATEPWGAEPDRPGLLFGTTVATAQGWRAVEDLVMGDRVLTFDRGLRPLRAIRHRTVETGGPETWPLVLPAGALGNTEAAAVLPDQAVMVECNLAEGLLGDAFVLIPAATLHGVGRVAQMQPGPRLSVVDLEFDGDEVLFTREGVLLYCPPPSDSLSGLLGPLPRRYAVQVGATAQAVVQDLQWATHSQGSHAAA